MVTMTDHTSEDRAPTPRKTEEHGYSPGGLTPSLCRSPSLPAPASISWHLAPTTVRVQGQTCFTHTFPSTIAFFFPWSSSMWWLELPRWRSGKESACQTRRCGFNSSLRKVPWSRKWQPTAVFLPGKFHGQRSLAATVHDVAESDTTEQTAPHSMWDPSSLTRDRTCVPCTESTEF